MYVRKKLFTYVYKKNPEGGADSCTLIYIHKLRSYCITDFIMQEEKIGKILKDFERGNEWNS